MAEPTPHTEVPGGHAVFPPFDTQQFPSQVFWLLVTFILLYVVMAKVALPRIVRFSKSVKSLSVTISLKQSGSRENQTLPMLPINNPSLTPTRMHNRL
jgi:Plant ATP synthase F0